MSAPSQPPLYHEDARERFRSALNDIPIDEDTRESIETAFLEAILTDSVSSDPGVGPLDSVSETAPVFEDGDLGVRASITSSDEPQLPDRYIHMGFIASGSMGEVHRVFDRTLRRVVAMKIIRADLKHPVQAAARFVEEAQISAQLGHPGVVAIHDLARLADGRFFFTAKEARGRTLTAIIKEVHAVRLATGAFGTTETGWNFRRLIDAFFKLCETMAYAHARRVVHRDIKPDNVLVGDYGEVLVLDWGLARSVGLPEDLLDKSPFIPVESDSRAEGAIATRDGTVAGTPAFMAPEQARGEHHLLSPASDVYAMGGVLYMMLYGVHPYDGLTAREALERVRRSPPVVPDVPWVPSDLVAICRKALSADARERFADGKEMAQAVEAWDIGASARERARSRVEAVRSRVQDLTTDHRKAVRRRDRARGALARQRISDPLEVKERAWAEEEAAIQALVELEDAYQDVAQELRTALTECPGLPEAMDALADLYRDRYDTALALGDEVLARSFERLVQEYDTGRHTAFLTRSGRVSLTTLPEGAEVEVHSTVNRARRLVLDPAGSLGSTPLVNAELAVGNYVLKLKAPGCRTVSYPLEISRGGVWEAVAPGEAQPRPILLPPERAIPRNMVYVPAGWAIFGGDPEASGALPRQRLWCEGFYIARHPVTHAEYLAFLNGLLEEGREDEALRRVPARTARPGAKPSPIYARTMDRGFVLPMRNAQEPLLPTAPVSWVTWHDAVAFCLWLQRRTGLAWRLPGEAEREKAARGVDGRPFPWGTYSDPAFHCFRDAMLEAPGPPEVDRFPIDTSPYEVCGLAGGVADWCAEPYRQSGLALQGVSLLVPEPPTAAELQPAGQIKRYSVRGGSFDGSARAARAASRAGEPSNRAAAGIGFRMALTELRR